VAAQIIPWNFPLLMLAWKIAPALAAGNTVVLKPAETTSLTALLFAEIVQQAELPDGVVNIVTGAGETGAALVRHPDVNKVAFTGSTAVGREIAKAVAGTGKKVTLELGGKAANIVFDDAPIDQAIEGIVNGIFFNQGHVCCAGSRLLVQENIHDEVVERLKARLATLRLGDPLDKNTDIGAINSREQLDRIRELSDIGEAEGAEGAGRERGVRVGLVVLGRRGAREVEDDLGIGGERLADVADLEMEVRILPRAREVVEAARHQVVETDDLVSPDQEPVDEVRADEAGGAGDENGFACRSESQGNLQGLLTRAGRRRKSSIFPRFERMPGVLGAPDHRARLVLPTDGLR
jgi:hypothetical protein